MEIGFSILIFDYFFKYETIETHARAFLALIILAIGRVSSPLYTFVIVIFEQYFINVHRRN